MTALVREDDALRRLAPVDEQLIDEWEERVSASIPSLSYEHLIYLRYIGERLQQAGWRVVCRVDAELGDRERQSVGGKGHAGTVGVGIAATRRALEAETGVSERTMQRNAEIYRAFLDPERGVAGHTPLQDKSFYEEALRAPDELREAALGIMADNKAANPGYSRRDARRDVLRLRQEYNARQAAERAREDAPGVEQSRVRVFQADCMTFIDSLEDGSVDLLLTDPPYAVTEYEWDTWPDRASYTAFMRRWLAAMRPKMAASYTAFVFCDADYSADLCSLLHETGWDVLRQVIWHRPNLAKKRAGSMTFLSAYEPFWHCGNQPLAMPEEWGEERFDVQRFAVPQSNHTVDAAMHPAQKPLALFERLVSLGSKPDSLVVDPFCGSGTTAVAAARHGRRCYAADTSEEYVAVARGRLSEEACRDRNVS